MVDKNSEFVLDTAEYKAQTDDLIDSIDETTALLSEMADNMAQLSDSFENFGTNNQERNISTPTSQSQSSVTAD